MKEGTPGRATRDEVSRCYARLQARCNGMECVRVGWVSLPCVQPTLRLELPRWEARNEELRGGSGGSSDSILPRAPPRHSFLGWPGSSGPHFPSTDETLAGSSRASCPEFRAVAAFCDGPPQSRSRQHRPLIESPPALEIGPSTQDRDKRRNNKNLSPR